MWVTMVCKFPNPCWFAINVQNAGVLNSPSYSKDITTSPTYLDTANKYWDILYLGWNNRPDIPAWLSFGKGSIPAILLEAGEGLINVQIEVLNDIRHGEYEGKNLYTDVERDRVGTIGFKPVWSPGGFQV